jgi:murein DD-endopeptidase MepM/ murein hydrolase activator NlpD
MRKKLFWGLAFGSALALGLSACFAPFTGGASESDGPLTESAPTALIAMDETAGTQASESAFPTLTALPPLRLTIPTPGAEPISDWRPPLYPVPWAISPHDHFYFIRPIPANEVNWPLASYRYGGIFFRDVVHSGVDIPSSMGTPIIAAGNGTVIWADWGFFSGWRENKADPYGQAVVLEHDFGYLGQPLYTVYAHMSRIDVVEGQWVQAGEQLGLVGDTGQTTGPHLHFEVRLEENTFYNTYNPELWIAPPQGWGVLAGFVGNKWREPIRNQRVDVYSFDTGRLRTVRTYGPKVVNGDAYYQENLVLSDLPAGWYELRILYEEKEYRQQIEIFPGQVSYFSFEGDNAYTIEFPEERKIDIFPQDTD